ncbi:CDP-alcohol phosphatidyltransferase family protein [Patescibacteria group bacterium]|nr:CDP-alcohol phosphatidyltransferase family protein [Patescibacteria group bacterium]MBU1921709.1 CDP-alcohol phosphatidyltransferase family protein [Patescibacteria group bacterium]
MKIFDTIFEIKEENAQKIVRHFPVFVTPNFLTWGRILLLPLLLILIWTNLYITALIIFVFAYLLDFLDGPLARARGQITDFGALFDPFADKIIFLPVLLMLGHKALAIPILATIFILEIILIILALILRPIAVKLKFKIKLGANIYGKTKMFFQVMGVIFLFLTPYAGLFTQIACIIFLFAIIFAMASIIEHIFSIRRK